MNKYTNINSVQFSSVTQQCPTLHDPTDCSTLASLSITNSQSSLKLTSVSLVMPSNDLILCHPLLLLPSGGFFPVSRLFTLGGQSIGASTSASVLPMDIQGLFPLRWTGFISLPSKEPSRVFSNTMVQKYQSLGTQPS